MTQIPPNIIFMVEQILEKSESKVGYDLEHPRPLFQTNFLNIEKALKSSNILIFAVFGN